MIDPERIAELRRRYDGCFACGLANPGGLHLDGFAVEGGEVRVPFHPRFDHRGFPEVLHGGIVAAALDEVMAWAAILIEGVTATTATLELRYRSPAPWDGSYQLVGRVDDRSGRRLRSSSDLLAGTEAVATASGLYVVRDDLL